MCYQVGSAMTFGYYDLKVWYSKKIDNSVQKVR